MQLRPIHMLLGLAVLLGLSTPARAAASVQDDGAGITRAEAALAEEQALIARQLRRVREVMKSLADIREKEGRIHAAKLLRDALEELDRRDLQDGGTTLEELMDASRDDLRGGRSMAALEPQEQTLRRVVRLMNVLLDRKNLDDLDESLKSLKEIKAQLQALKDEERSIIEDTEELREDSKNDAQKDLESALESALQEQRKLLADAEKQARSSGLFDLEQLKNQLDALVSDQELGSKTFSAWSPKSTQELEVARPDLTQARASEAEAKRLRDAAETLREAAEEARAMQGSAAPDEAADALSKAASREQRNAQVAPDESAKEAARQAADALTESAKEMAAASDQSSRESAAQNAEARASELEAAAAEAAARAAAARAAAKETIDPIAGTPSMSGAAAERVQEALDAAQAQSGEEGARQSTEEALRKLDEATDAEARLSQALEASQAEGAKRAQAIAEGLERAGEAGQSPAAKEAGEALEQAAEAMAEAEKAARNLDAKDAAEQAQAASEALAKAQAAMEQAMAEQQASASSDAASERKATAEAQAALAEQVAAAQSQASQGSMSPEAQAGVEQAMQKAQEAMEKAAEQLQSPGESRAASKSQSEAIEALDEALDQAQAGVEPQGQAGEDKAQELAERQRKVEEELLDLARRNAEREGALSDADIKSAAESASEAAESLEQAGGSPPPQSQEENDPKKDLSEAVEEERETERKIDEALAELEEEEQQYQELRQEELLFQIAEEVEAMLVPHREQMAATSELDASREGTRVTRALRVRLRGIAREEEAILARATKVADALEGEGVIVFHEIVRNVEADLVRIVRSLGESYSSGDRVQALQEDVLTSLEWLEAALRQELEDREQQESEPPPPSEGEPQEPPLVPDVAELKLLRQLETEVLARIQQFVDLHPELRDPEIQPNPLVLEDISRLAYRHRRVAELFSMFRERLGIPSAEDAPD
ncbi:MAG: hypothetical protein ACI9HE_001663 [Planctomycetota bacterium]|jgi:hypothetical protein